MDVDQHWCLFIEQDEVKWSFGSPSTEFQTVVLNFVTGMGKFGEELFGEEGIASIHFDLKKYSGMKASEIFIVSLKNQFHLVVSDPSVTLLLINASDGIPFNIKEIMKAVLVGQASILYANSISEANLKKKELIDKQLQDIILDINEQYLENNQISVIVGKSGSNFSILSFEECLLLHLYIRRQSEQTDFRASSSWCLISEVNGGDIPFSFNMEDEILYGGYFSAIISLIDGLFESRPKYIAFGSSRISKLRFVYGKEYFMAIDTSFMIDLLLQRKFQNYFFETSYKTIKDLAEGMKVLIVEEILQFSEEKLAQMSTEALLDRYIGEGIGQLELFIGEKKENIELLRDERKNQVLRVWGKLLLEL
ncbi:MAG: hypothetical protein ACW964_01350 [Candidatus Hodarchaeales archaeon]